MIIIKFVELSYHFFLVQQSSAKQQGARAAKGSSDNMAGNRSNTGMTTNQLLFIQRTVLKPLWNHQISTPFKQPVDAVKLNLPDYHTIIKHPMDMGTIKKRLEQGYYSKAEQCIQDFQQMFTNCYTYNPPQHVVYQWGQKLEKMFVTHLAKMPQQELSVPLPDKAQRGRKKGSVNRVPPASYRPAIPQTAPTTSKVAVPPPIPTTAPSTRLPPATALKFPGQLEPPPQYLPVL